MKKILIISLMFFTKNIFAGGSSSLDILKSDISPIAISLGGSYVANGNDITSVYYNPSSLAVMDTPELGFSYSNGFEENKINYFGFAFPTPYKGFSQFGNAVLGFSLQTTSLGTFDYRVINNDGSITSGKFDSEKNMVFTLSYAERSFQGETRFEKTKLFLDHYLGFSVKYIKSILLQSYKAKSFAFDLGYKVIEKEKGLAFGLSVSNLGGNIKYIDESYPLPEVLRAGISYRTDVVREHQIMSTFEYDNFINDKESVFKLGFEYFLENILNFRVGYTTGYNKGSSIGIGLQIDSISLDLSTSFLSLYNYSALSLSYKFPSIEKKENKKDKKYKIEKDKKYKEKVKIKTNTSEDLLLLF